MSDEMPKEIFSYHKEHGTGTWIDFDDSCDGDLATPYTRTDQTAEMQAAIVELRSVLESLHNHNSSQGDVGFMSKGKYITWNLGEAYTESKFYDDSAQALANTEKWV